MPGLGHKLWTRERLTSAELQGYLQDQVIQVYASASARSAGVASPSEGMAAYLMDSNQVTVYDGAAWVPVQGITDTAPTALAGYLTNSFAVGSDGATCIRVSGICHYQFHLTRATAWAAGAQVLTFPDGFRPKRTVWPAASVPIGELKVATTGVVTIGPAGGTILVASGSFPLS